MALGRVAHTHVSDHPQFLNVGGLSVQELPHRLLLVALPPGQLLWEGRAQPGRGRVRNCVLPPFPGGDTEVPQVLGPLPLRQLNGTLQFHSASVSPKWLNDDNSLTACHWVLRRAPRSGGIMSSFAQKREEEG